MYRQKMELLVLEKNMELLEKEKEKQELKHAILQNELKTFMTKTNLLGYRGILGTLYMVYIWSLVILTLYYSISVD